MFTNHVRGGFDSVTQHVAIWDKKVSFMVVIIDLGYFNYNNIKNIAMKLLEERRLAIWTWVCISAHVLSTADSTFFMHLSYVM